jgi:WD40 repeat protein
LAQEAFDRGATETARTSLANCPLSLRGWEWHALNWRIDQSLKASRDHAAYVTAIAFTPDASQIVSSSVDQTMRVWNVDGDGSSTVRAKFDASVQDLALSRDGKTVAVARRDGPIEIINLGDGRRLQSLGGHDREACSVAFSPDGRLLVSGGGAADQSVKLWDWRAGREIHAGKGHLGKVWAVAFSPDGKRIASGGYDGSVRIWDGLTGTHLQHLGEMADLVNAVAFSPDGRRLAAACNDGSISVWQIDPNEKLYQAKVHGADVNAVVFSPDGAALATGSKDGTIAICDAATGAPLNRLRGHAESVIDLAFGSDGATLASCGRAGEVMLWDPNAVSLRRSPVAADGEIGLITMLPDKSEFLTAASYANQKWQLNHAIIDRKYDRSVSADAQTNQDRSQHQHADDLAVSSDGTLVADTAGQTIKIMDVKSGSAIREIPVGCNLLCLAFAPDSRAIYGAGKSITLDGREQILLYAFDVASGNQLWQAPGHTWDTRALAVGPDGKEIWTSGDDRFILVRDARDGKIIRKLAGHSKAVWEIKFSPDGKLAASAADDAVLLWDPQSDRSLRTLPHAPGRVRIAFHPTQPRLATLGGDGWLRIWDIRNGNELLKCDIKARHLALIGDAQQPSKADPAKSPDRGYLNQLLSRLGGRRAALERDAKPSSLAFSPDGATLLVGDTAGHLWYWQTVASTRPTLELAAADRTVAEQANAAFRAKRFSERATDLVNAGKTGPFDKTAAIELATKACALTEYKDPHSLVALGTVYRAAEDLDAAIRTVEMALALVAPDGDAEQRKQIEQQLANYRYKKRIMAAEDSSPKPPDPPKQQPPKDAAEAPSNATDATK